MLRDRRERDPTQKPAALVPARTNAAVGHSREDSTCRTAGAPEQPLMIGDSPVMHALRARIRRAAAMSRPILISGPTGSGKELVAQTAHALGPHPEAPILDLNCGTLTDALIDSQLFGHEKGSFSGADRQTVGFLAAVGIGTLFLDEIAELPLIAQTRLLRVMETGRFRRVGSTSDGVFVGRIIAASHADLVERVAQGRFREDLYQRLDVLNIRVPALDERREDIPALIDHFVRQQTRPLRFTREALDALTWRPWPGNVRQLRNLVDKVAAFAEDDDVTLTVLEAAAQSTAPEAHASLRSAARMVLSIPATNKLEAIEAALIDEAMTACNGNKSEAARCLGVHRKMVERRVHRPGDSEPPDDA